MAKSTLYLRIFFYLLFLERLEKKEESGFHDDTWRPHQQQSFELIIVISKDLSGLQE